MRIAGALALAGSSIVDARIFTTADGLALDSFGIQNVEERTAVEDDERLARIRRQVRQSACRRDLAGSPSACQIESRCRTRTRGFRGRAAGSDQ